MSIVSSFQPMGNTLAAVSSGTTLTPTSQQIQFPGAAGTATGIRSMPPQCRVVNTGTSPIFISFTNSPRTAVVPVAGTPSLEFAVLPSEDVIFTVGASQALDGSIYLNMISAGLSQAFYLTFGEGI